MRILLGLLVVLAGTVLAQEQPFAPSEARLTVVILDFENKTSDAEHEHWRSGLARFLRWQLGNVQGVRVRSDWAIEYGLRQLGRKKSEALTALDARALGEQIQASQVIWGSYARADNLWEVRLHTLRTASGERLPEIVAKGTNWLALRDHLSARLLEALELQPSEAERRKMAQRPTTSSMALEYYAKAHALNWANRQQALEMECLARQGLELEPHSASLRRLLAGALYGQGKAEEAVDQLRQALELRPDDASAHASLGMIRFYAGDLHDAEIEAREALRLDAEDVQALKLAGTVSAIQEKWDDAIATITKARELDPFDAGLHGRLARFYAAKRERARALRAMSEAERLGQEDLDAEQMMAEAYALLEDLPKAVEHYERLMALAKKDEVNADLLGGIAERVEPLKARLTPVPVQAARPRAYSRAALRRELKVRLTSAERALVVNPVETTSAMRAWARTLTKSGTNDLSRARLLFDALNNRFQGKGQIGKQRTARETFREWANPEVTFSCHEYANLYVALAREAGLDAWFVHLERDHSGRAVYHDCAGVFLKGQTLLVDAAYKWFGAPHREFTFLDDLEMIAHHAAQVRGEDTYVERCRLSVKLQPNFAWGRVVYAGALQQAGQSRQAGEELARAFQLESNRWDAFFLQARIAGQGGDRRAALGALEKARDLNPENLEIHYYLAAELTNSGQLEEAAAELRLALQYAEGWRPGEAEMVQQAEKNLAELDEVLAAKSGDAAGRAALRKRADAGVATAQRRLGFLLLRDANPDVPQALKWMTLAAEQGDRVAQGTLGELYYEGRWVEKNPAEALKWLRPAAEHGEADAAFLLAQIHFQGNDTTRDEKEAYQWGRRAAELGHTQAQFHLGRDYARGRGVEEDPIEAHKWLSLASAAGHRDAKHELTLLELFMTPDQISEAKRRLQKFQQKERREP